MRAVLFRIFRKKSPFEGLEEHSRKVLSGVRKFREAFLAYLKNDYPLFEELSREVIKIETEADMIKGNIRNHLPKGLFMPVDKSVFLSCLKEQDAILDACKDVVIWLEFQKNRLNPNLRRKLEDFLSQVLDTVEKLESMLKDVRRLVSSLSMKERKEIKKRIREIHFEEEEVDLVQRSLIKEIFSSGEDALYVYHLIHIIFILSKVADHAENAADGARVMIAR
ncbi:MAG: TIGR00153 family protein [Elusimicrobia bacterium]|nr:TIGR00153 family protein [Elusimicrobiota bacterium]